jgi:hypothetical protein
MAATARARGTYCRQADPGGASDTFWVGCLQTTSGSGTPLLEPADMSGGTRECTRLDGMQPLHLAPGPTRLNLACR